MTDDLRQCQCIGGCKTTAIQESLDVISAWSRDWQLSISYAKRSLMFVGCHDVEPNDAVVTSTNGCGRGCV